VSKLTKKDRRYLKKWRKDDKKARGETSLWQAFKLLWKK